MIVLQRVFKLAHNVRIARRSRYTKRAYLDMTVNQENYSSLIFTYLDVIWVKLLKWDNQTVVLDSWRSQTSLRLCQKLWIPFPEKYTFTLHTLIFVHDFKDLDLLKPKCGHLLPANT